MMKLSNRVGFVKHRALGTLLFCSITLALASFTTPHAVAQGQSSGTPAIEGTYRGLTPAVKFDVSPPLREMGIILAGGGEIPENEDREIIPFRVRFAPEWDPAVQATPGNAPGKEIPGPLVSFNGQPNINLVTPPDPNAAVGPNHVVAMCNLTFQIFDKSGNSLFGPANNNTLWAGFGGACQTSNSGDPVVLYDQLADRWLLSQFTASGAPYMECIAISTTNDPTGSYYRYAFSTGNNFPDYPKVGVWPDAYYFSTREFANGVSFVGVGAYALNRAQALAGNPNPQLISFLVPPVGGGANVGDGLLPSDLDGSTLPPPGSPNFFLGSQDNNGPYGAAFDALNLYRFHADFNTPANSTFTLASTIPVAPFNSTLAMCNGGRACIPQPGTSTKIDHQGYRQRPIFRLAYRNFGAHESLVTNQSVSAGAGPNGEVSGIRWWEVRNPNGSPSVFQEGTYAPGLTDGIHRWMGSVAMDGQGNMALGYSASNGSNPAVFPSVWYTGRLANDPLGTLPQGEGSIIDGTGSLTTTSSRWGDYTSLTVDPTDDQTFWYCNEWVPVTSSLNWVLRIGSFKLATGGGGGTNLVSAASRLTHGSAGTFDINMPLSGTSGVEDRSSNNYNAVFTFDRAVTSGNATVFSGTATAGPPSFSGNEMIVPLSGVANAQVVSIRVQNVNGGGSPSQVDFGFLVGDVDSNRIVQRADAIEVRGNLRQPANGSNFRNDIDASGGIVRPDFIIVKGALGTSIP